jgi:hypothetical protein
MAYPNHQYSLYDWLGQYQGHANINPYQGLYSPAVSPDYVPENSPPPPTHESTEPAKKTVTFKSTCTVRVPRRREDEIVEDKTRLYYTRAELNMIKLEATALCMLSRALPAIEGSGTHLDRRDSIINKSCALATDTPRGLERAMYPARDRTKIIAMRSLLKYQRLLDAKPNLTSEEKRLALAGASRKLTAWSTLVAMETARWDALRAHDRDDYPIPIVFEPVTITSPFPFYKKRTRRVTAEDEASAKRRKVEENV